MKSFLFKLFSWALPWSFLGPEASYNHKVLHLWSILFIILYNKREFSEMHVAWVPNLSLQSKYYFLHAWHWTSCCYLLLCIASFLSLHINSTHIAQRFFLKFTITSRGGYKNQLPHYCSLFTSACSSKMWQSYLKIDNLLIIVPRLVIIAHRDVVKCGDLCLHKIVIFICKWQDWWSTTVVIISSYMCVKLFLVLTYRQVSI